MADFHLFTHEFRPKRGGAGVVCEQIAETLTGMGKEVTVWVPGYVGQDDAVRPKYDLRVLRRLKGTRNLGCLLITAREVVASRKTLRNTTVYLAEPGPVAVFMWLTLFYRRFWKRLVITLHGSELLRYRKDRWFGTPLFRRLAAKADVIHVLSTYNENELLEWLPELKPKVVRGYGMSMPGEALPALQNRGTQVDRVRILCVGRIHPRKGQLELLQAVATLPTDLRSRVEVVFVGQLVKDAYHKTVMEVAETCGATVKCLGGISDEALQKCYREADVFALTSVPYGSSVEGLGLVYLEAARHGLPLLAHRIGGVSDVVLDEVNGLVADPADPTSLTRQLARLVSDGELRHRLGLEARRLVEACSWEPVVRRMFKM